MLGVHKKGEEKLKVFCDVLKDLDELTIIGYSFSDTHINHRISNAMVLNDNLKLRIIDPTYATKPDFLQQFDYDMRIRGGRCRAAEWMEYSESEKWNTEQTNSLKENEKYRSRIKQSVKSKFLKCTN